MARQKWCIVQLKHKSLESDVIKTNGGVYLPAHNLVNEMFNYEAALHNYLNEFEMMVQMINYRKIRIKDDWLVYSYEPDDSGKIGEIAINIISAEVECLLG